MTAQKQKGLLPQTLTYMYKLYYLAFDFTGPE